MIFHNSILFILILIFSNNIFARNYDIVSSSDNCSMYLQLEDKLKCSSQKEHSSEYLSNYGYKYCSRFLRERDAWPANLKVWAKSTTKCLQDMLINNNERINPCDQLESFAFDTHPICYKQYGYCDFTVKELRKIVRILDEIDLYIKFKKSFSQWINIAISCPNKSIFDEALAYFRILFEYFSIHFPNPNQKTLSYIINLLSGDQADSKNYFLNLSLAVSKNDPSFQVTSLANANALNGYLVKGYPKFDGFLDFNSSYLWHNSVWTKSTPNSYSLDANGQIGRTLWPNTNEGKYDSPKNAFLGNVDYNDELLRKIKNDFEKLK